MKKSVYVAALLACMVGGWGVAAAVTGSVPRADSPELAMSDGAGAGSAAHGAAGGSAQGSTSAGFAITGEDTTDQCGVRLNITKSVEVTVSVNQKSDLTIQFAADAQTQSQTSSTQGAGTSTVSFSVPTAPSFSWRVQCVDPGTGAQTVRTGTGVDNSRL